MKEMNQKPLTTSSENYLEAVLMVQEKKGVARSVDLAQKLGVDPRTAEDDACRVEHDISDETFSAMKACSRSLQRNKLCNCSSL